MTSHPTDIQLETLLLDEKGLPETTRKEIEAHIQECSLCREHLEMLKRVYSGIDANLQLPPTDRDGEVARTLFITGRKALPQRGLQRWTSAERVREGLDTFAEIIEPSELPLLQRFTQYVQVYPIRVAGATSIAVAAVVLAALFLRAPKDTNPTFAAVKNSVLTVQNKKGEVLWTRTAIGIPDTRSDESLDRNQSKRFLSIADVDGDGKQEILLSGAETGGEFAGDTLYCFEGNDRLRWKAGVGKMISFGQRGLVQHSTTLITDWLITKRRRTDQTQLFVIGEDRFFSPAKLFEIDTKTGSELQCYFHRGHCPLLHAMNVNGDETTELLLAGENDGFNLASLAVLDPAAINGYGPIPPQYIPVDTLKRAEEMYYILFPRTDLGELVGRAPFNQVNMITSGATRTVIINVKESTGNPKSEEQATVIYVCGPTMQVISVLVGDPFKKTYQRFVDEGKIAHPLTPAYTENLKNSVLYWDGEKFVNRPTMNRLYPAARRLP